MVIKFIDQHSRELAIVYKTQYLHSHRHVNESDLAHVKALGQVGIKVC